MFILSVNSDLDAALRSLGHCVHSVSLAQPGIYALRDLLKPEDARPDVILQKENLGIRILFKDLHTFSCAKAFWSIDTHLNYYWQQYYGRLFDAFFTPHKTFLSRTGSGRLPTKIFRLPAAGLDRAWTPHPQRAHTLNFVGRLTTNRPLRENFCRVLREQHQIRPLDGLSRSDMLALYEQTRIIPNEAIAFETNFRLLEGASCGGCVISPDIGEDQDALFTPDKEVLIYREALECLALIDDCLAHPDQAERIGQAARARVQAEHLPIHRARAFCDALEQLPRTAATGSEAHDSFAMTVCLLHLNQALTIANFDSFRDKSFDNQAMRCQMALFAAVETGNLHLAWKTIELSKNFFAKDGRTTVNERDLAVACGGFALSQRDMATSLLFFQEYERLSNRPAPVVAHDFIAHCEAWIDALLLDHNAMTLGMQYREGRCRHALDFLLLLAEKEPTDSAWARKFHETEAFRHALAHIEFAAVSRLKLARPELLETSIEFIYGSLRMFDLPRARAEYEELLDRTRQHGIQSQVDRLLRMRVPHVERL